MAQSASGFRRGRRLYEVVERLGARRAERLGTPIEIDHLARGQRGACRLGLAFLLAAAVLAAPAHAAERVASAIVFAVDVSGSVDTERYEVQRAGIASVFVNPGIAQMLQGGLAVMLMEWADDHTVTVPWTILRAPADALAFAARIRNAPRSPGYSTALSLALLAAADLLDGCGCEAQHRMIDVSGDGPNNGPISTKLARDDVLKRGIRINGLPIVTPAEPDLAQWYADNVAGGDGAFVEVAEGYEDFARAMRRKFSLEVAGGASERAALAAQLSLRGARRSNLPRASRPCRREIAAAP